MTRSTTRTLPVTGWVVPASPAFTFGPYKQLPTHDGVAFNVPLKVGGKVIGTLENEGRGGGTYFYPHSVEGRRIWEDYYTAWKAIREAEGASFLYEEAAADELVDEADIGGRILRAAKRGTVCRAPQESTAAWRDSGWEYATAKAPVDLVAPDAARKGYEVWTPTGWVDASALVPTGASR